MCSICSKVLIFGYSAGAVIAGSVLERIFPRDRILGFVAVGYPFGWFASWLFGGIHFKALAERSIGIRKLFIQGDSDGFTSSSTLKSKIKKIKTENPDEVQEV
jgi:uncharacterized protein